MVLTDRSLHTYSQRIVVPDTVTPVDGVTVHCVCVQVARTAPG